MVALVLALPPGAASYAAMECIHWCSKRQTIGLARWLSHREHGTGAGTIVYSIVAAVFFILQAVASESGSTVGVTDSMMQTFMEHVDL